MLAHIVETLRGEPFEHTIRASVFAPPGMERSFYFPEECVSHRVAAGHIVPAQGPRVARLWHTNRGSAGGRGVVSSAVNRLRHAAFHPGIVPAPDVLSPSAVAVAEM